jgi:hypothetical protein
MSGEKPPLPYIPSWRVQRQLGLLLVASMFGLIVATSLLSFIS